MAASNPLSVTRLPLHPEEETERRRKGTRERTSGGSSEAAAAAVVVVVARRLEQGFSLYMEWLVPSST